MLTAHAMAWGSAVVGGAPPTAERSPDESSATERQQSSAATTTTAGMAKQGIAVTMASVTATDADNHTITSHGTIPGPADA